MAVNLETLVKDLTDLGYPSEVTDPIIDVSKNSNLPHSVELEEWKKLAAEDPEFIEGRAQLGLAAREIALINEVKQLSPTEGGVIFANEDTGMILRVFAYDQIDEKHLKGEVSRLGIIIENPGNVADISRWIKSHPLISGSFDINVNLLSQNFGEAVPANSIVNRAISHWPHPERILPRHQGMARILVDNLNSSRIVDPSELVRI